MTNKSLFRKFICLTGLSLILSSAMAQDKINNNVPEAITAAFKSRYPQAQIKGYKQIDSAYEVRFINNDKKYLARFDQNGHWFETVSKVSWQWRLPEAVKTGLRNSAHANWHTYDVSFVENASETHYRVLVDNTNHPVDAEHQLVLTQDWEIDINSFGKVVNEKYLN